MTCIVGLEHNNSVYIGGDSLGSTSGVTIVRQDKKVFHNGETLIGFTSSYRMGQLVTRLKFPNLLSATLIAGWSILSLN